ncbi:nucleoid-associated protein [Paratractidigestivibacter sp.]|uniref:nucleoid-associated protein n=1 Tax=Paratractidigestivibacter sp. TaxID=2847316 RepID=UPI002ABE6F3D|nr:nucleoid-associated protein [Paratractidigestivibacter sp.]
MLKVSQAILHVFDFEEGSRYFSERPLDLEARATKSYVQRRLRKIVASPESNHGEFTQDSGFAGELEHYLMGGTEFAEFSVRIADWFWNELRRAEDLEQVDLLAADFTDTDAAPVDAAASDAEFDAAFDGPAGKRFFAIALLPRKQSFVHEVGGSANEILRMDTTLPNPTAKIDTYALIDCDSFAIDFHDKERTIGTESVQVLPDKFLQCSAAASTREVFDEVSVIVSDVAEEYGLTPAVEVGRAKAVVAQQADRDEVVQPAEVGRVVFEDRPDVQEVFEERVREAKLPEEAPVRRGVANRLAKNHKIKTDTGIEITFPSDLADKPGYLDFATGADGTITISIGNVAHIENK